MGACGQVARCGAGAGADQGAVGSQIVRPAQANPPGVAQTPHPAAGDCSRSPVTLPQQLNKSGFGAGTPDLSKGGGFSSIRTLLLGLVPWWRVVRMAADWPSGAQ